MVPAKKRRHLERLSDASGRFSMLAVDQRQSLRKMISAHTGVDPPSVSAADLQRVKRAVVEAVAPLATAVLLDPIYGYPAALRGDEPGGVLVSAEVTGYRAAPGGERRSRLVDGWDPDALRGRGVSAVKLLLWHDPGASEATRRYQEELAERVGARCAEAGLPFLLEAKTYLAGEGVAGVDFARAKPALVLDAAKTYSAPRFGVDLLKLEFPMELKHTEEYRSAAFGRPPILYDRAEAEVTCQRLDEAAGVPWVILSAGVEMEEFLEDIRLATAAGASGFLCGRTVWKDVIDHFPDADRMRAHMVVAGRKRFEALCAANEGARPWYEHPHFRSNEPTPAS